MPACRMSVDAKPSFVGRAAQWLFSAAAFETIGYVYPYLRQNRMVLALIIGLGLIVGLLESAGIASALLLLSILIGSGDAAGALAGTPFGPIVAAIPASVLTPITASVILFALIVGRMGFTIVHGLMTSRIALRIAHRMRLQLFEGYAALPFEAFREKSWGEIYTVIEERSHDVPEAIDGLSNLIQTVTILAIMGALLVWTAPQLSLVAVMVVVLLNVLVSAAQKHVERAGADYTVAAQQLSETLMRAIQSFRTLHILGLMSRQKGKFAAASRATAQSQLRADVLGLVTEPAAHIVSLLGIGAMAFATVTLGLDYATLLVAIGLIYRMESYFGALMTEKLALAEMLPSLRIISRAPHAHTGPDTRPDAPRLTSSIYAENLSFSYGKRQRPVLDHFTAEIAPGGWTVIDGPSGAGKSTLVNLLLGIIPPQNGRISIEGQSIDSFEPESWRANFAVCGQDIELFSGTLRENLHLGAAGKDRRDMRKALAISGLDGLLHELTDGLDTQLGEQAAQLSGGQRQRIGIARAILRDPQVLILDEATNMLDRVSEKRILKGLAEFMRGRTVIVIGHNLPSIPDEIARYEIGTKVLAPAAEIRTAQAL